MCTSNYYDYEIVDELVILLSGLSSGDLVIVMITTDDGEDIATFPIDGNSTSGAYISVPMENGNVITEYNIYVYLPENYTDVSYTLQVASRYIHGTKKCYASPSTLRNQGRDNFSSSASAVIKETDVPSSAIIDNIYTYGTLTNDKTGIIGICTMKIVNGSNELYSDGPTGYLKNLTSRNIPLAGTWYISYRPEWDNSSTLTNLSISFDYTYDILN